MENSWPIMHLTTVDSTNNFLLRLLKNQHIDHEMVVNARFQSDGRGQEDNKWESEPYSNLTFSILLKPTYLEPQNIFCLNQVISLAIVDYLENNHITARIKWPNDILVECKKIAGILIENSFIGNSIQYSIIGVGLNVNQMNFSNVQNRAISIKNIIGKEMNLDMVLHSLLNAIHNRLKLLKRKDYQYISDDYKSHLHLFQSWARFYDNNNVYFKGKIIDILPTGELCMMLENGGVKKFMNKELVFI